MIKLVRDKIPDKIRAEGREPKLCVRDQRLAEILFAAKLAEETAEYMMSGDPLELTDLYEVVLSMWRRHGRSEEDLLRAAAIKRNDVGSFDRLIVLELNE